MENEVSAGLRFEPVEDVFESRIRVLGVGEGAARALNRMIDAGTKDVGFIAADTDQKALDGAKAAIKVRLDGLLNGEDGAVGHKEGEILAEALSGADLAVLVGCLGGRAGMEVLPALFGLVSRLEIPCLAVVTLPYEFEGRSRSQRAENALRALKTAGAAMIIVPCDKLLETASLATSMKNAFELADTAILEAARSVIDLVSRGGRVEMDRRNLEVLFKDLGPAYLGMGAASGKYGVREAVQKAVFGPLLIDHPLENAGTVFVRISSGDDLSVHEIARASQDLHHLASSKTEIILRTVIDPGLRKKVKATLVVGNLEPDGDEGVHRAATPGRTLRPERRPAPREERLRPPAAGPTAGGNPWDPPEWERNLRYYEMPIQRRLKTASGRLRAGHPPGLPEEIPEEQSGEKDRES
jgi:cell division protein FtsZ